MAAAIKINKEQVLNFLRKHPVSIGCVGFCLLLGIFQFFRWDALPAAEAELEARTADAERLALNIKNAAQLKEHHDLMAASLKAIDSRLIHVSALATNLQYFYRIEAETNTKLLDLRQSTIPVGREKKIGSYIAVPYAVSIRGDYAKLISFLRHLESGNYFCRVNTAILSASKATSGAEKTEESADELLSLALNLELVGVP
jgi:hypothetical protein